VKRHFSGNSTTKPLPSWRFFYPSNLMIIFLSYVDTMSTEQYEHCNASGRQLQLQLNAILIQAIINTFKEELSSS